MIRISIIILIVVQIACVLPVAGLPTVSNTPLPTVEPEILPTVANTPLPTAQVMAVKSLNVRNRAGTRERVIGALYSQDSVTLTGRCSAEPSGWAEIVWESGTAWVNADYLSENKCSE